MLLHIDPSNHLSEINSQYYQVPGNKGGSCSSDQANTKILKPSSFLPNTDGFQCYNVEIEFSETEENFVKHGEHNVSIKISVASSTPLTIPFTTSPSPCTSPPPPQRILHHFEMRHQSEKQYSNNKSSCFNTLSPACARILIP